MSIPLLLLNYSHAIPAVELARVAEICGATPEVRVVATQIDRATPIAEVARALADAAGLSPEAWQITPLVVNPPALAPLALALIAELHGRCGGFPAMLNVRPVAGAIPTRYEVAEVVNLQTVRDAARRLR
ncbi:MAG: CRISPR-associated protein Csx15 [Chloroflexales bacterium]